MDCIVKQNLIGDRYSLRGPLGSGGMAEVFLAHDEVLKRDVALKILREQYADDEGFVERFRREAQSAASLNHPHIVVVYDWGRSESGGAYYMAMEYAPGGTLTDRILADGALPPRTAIEVAYQIAWALEAAHEKGVVHRDVKPQNVLLTAFGDAKVADFGIARAANATTTSRSNLILGTAGYMSPEQAKGEPVGTRSDLYSLGVVLYEMLTGELPYESDAPAVGVMKRVAEPPRSPREANPEVPEEIEALTLRLLAEDPADRYGSAAELLEDLRRVRERLSPGFAAAEPVATDRAVLPTTPVPKNPGEDGVSGAYVVYGRRFRKLPLALAAFVTVLILLGAAAWGPWSGSQELARAQDVSRGSLDGLGETFEKGEPTAAPKEEVADARSLPEDEGLGSSAKADTGSLKLVGLNLPSGDPVLREEGAVDQDPKAGVPVEPGTEVNTAAGSGPERVSVPEVSGGSAEEASHTLSEAGLVEAGTATRHSSELAGTVIGTEPSMGSTVKRGAAVSIVVSSGSPSQKASNGAEDAAHATVREETSVPTQPSKSRKPDQKPSK